MNIEETWKRIAAIHVDQSGRITAVWMAHDKQADTIYLYNAAEFETQDFPIIAEGLTALGRWIPIAWEHKAKEIADKLLDRGCNMTAEPTKETEELADVLSREINTRIKTDRFVINSRLQQVKTEVGTARRVDGKVPLDAHPYLSAMRHAIAMLSWSRSLRKKKRAQKKYQEVAIV